MNEELELAEQIFADINQHTLPGEGVTRPSYGAEETAAMRVVEHYAKAFGLKTSWDGVANLHCWLEGTGKEIVTGSHLDSVPRGGQYDGVAGVVAGLLAIRKIGYHCERKQLLRLIVFRGEESAWFGKCYLGSFGLFGLLTAEDLQRRSAHDNETLGRRIAHRGGWEEYARPGHTITQRHHLEPTAIDRFIEVHIEQGPVLQDAGEPIGIVDSIRGNYRYKHCSVLGEAGHSGTTPTRLRKDALFAFADLMQRLEQGAKVFGDDLVLTCGVAGTKPERHAITIIADLVEFDLEFRSSSSRTLELFERFFRASAIAVSEQRKTEVVIGERTVTAPVVMDQVVRKDLMIAARQALGSDGIPILPSGAGHDAAVFAQMGIPTGMIFIRNEHGSHNPRESMRMSDFILATRVLYRALGGT